MDSTGAGNRRISDWLISFRKAGYNPERADGQVFSELEDIEKEYLRRDLDFLEAAPVRIIMDGDENYPWKLTHFLNDKRPRMLFCIGDVSSFNKPSILVCGTRDASRKGCEIAYKCGRLIAEAGYIVVSGYARGVDIAAHQGAIEAGGNTIAILPYGLSRFSVRSVLKEVFEQDNFLVVSELPPSCGFMVKAALRRNKLLVAIADAVIVVEPGESGGTWYSADKARSLQKPIFYHEGSRPEIIERMESMGGKHLKISKGAPVLDGVYEMCK